MSYHNPFYSFCFNFWYIEENAGKIVHVPVEEGRLNRFRLMANSSCYLYSVNDISILIEYAISVKNIEILKTIFDKLFFLEPLNSNIGIYMECIFRAIFTSPNQEQFLKLFAEKYKVINCKFESFSNDQEAIMLQTVNRVCDTNHRTSFYKNNLETILKTCIFKPVKYFDLLRLFILKRSNDAVFIVLKNIPTTIKPIQKIPLGAGENIS